MVLVIAIAAVAAWLNTYVRSDAFRADVESRASASLGGPVHIEKIDFRVLSGVTLQGVTTQIDANHSDGHGRVEAQIATVSCTYAWTELLFGKLKLTGLSLDQPQFVVTKQAGSSSRSSHSGGTSAGSTSASSSETSASSGGSSIPFQFVLEKAGISDGSATIKNSNGATAVQLKGVNVSADTSGYTNGRPVTGTIKIAEATASSLTVTNFYTPFSYDDASGAITASSFSASAYSGNIAGALQPQSGAASILDLNGKGIDVGALTAATESSSSAKLTGTLNFSSKWRGIETGSLDGEGDATITSGKLEGVKILQEIGSILKVKELSEPAITKAVTHFTVQGDETRLTGLQIDSTVFSITGGGVVHSDSRINFNLVLILTSGAMSRLPSAVAASFVKQQDGTGTVAFNVTGTTANPQTDLPTRLLMQNTQIQNVINKTFNKLFH